jgi:preprotein translocase subunit SecG
LAAPAGFGAGGGDDGACAHTELIANRAVRTTSAAIVAWILVSILIAVFRG